MNFLAHLHLAHLAQSSLPGNLLADFVRGNPDGRFSSDTVAGIHMHRRVDALTDSLPEVVLARSWFTAHTRRVSSISLDIMWDHFLSRHWDTLCPTLPLSTFIAYARGQIEPALPGMPPRFINLNHYLWRERWLERYQDMAFIAEVLNKMASRRPKLAALQDSWHDLDRHYDKLASLFWQFYPQMMALAEQKNL